MQFFTRYIRLLDVPGNDPVSRALRFMPMLAYTTWAAVAALVVASTMNSSLVGALVFTVLAFGFNVNWENVGRPNGGFNFGASMAVGAVSSAIIGWLFYAMPVNQVAGAVALGWVMTGCLNVRFANWFWGPPVVFENRGFGNVLAFLSGPIYWACWIFFFSLALIGEGLGWLINKALKPTAA